MLYCHSFSVGLEDNELYIIIRTSVVYPQTDQPHLMDDIYIYIYTYI